MNPRDERDEDLKKAVALAYERATLTGEGIVRVGPDGAVSIVDRLPEGAERDPKAMERARKALVAYVKAGKEINEAMAEAGIDWGTSEAVEMRDAAEEQVRNERR